MPVTASILDLKNMISFPTTIPSRESMETLKLDGNSPLALRQVEQEAYIDQILQRSNIKTAGLDRALMDSATDSVADTSRSKDFDILRRHGQTFLETFLRRAKIQSAHRKALKVYLKWRKQYAGPQEDKQAGERLSRPEVAIIMRSSRVLHFCRTPLAFCDPEKDWSFLKDGSPGKIAVLQWFKTMANDLMAEYAKYLEKADMQLLDFAKPDHGDNSNLRISYFSIGKHLNAECPPTHLLRVFEGGSIICEVRLTSIFVSVTLYILHRQYGGLNYNAFKRETRQKKRSSFMKFEETCGHFKQMIHINSFVHDFQLRYLQKMLRDPNCFPADIDIMSFVKRFAHFNQQPSPYSKDRIISGYYEFEVTILNSTTFFENLFKIAPRQALNVIVGSDGYKAVTASSSTLSFRLDSNEHGYSSDWMYTLVMSPAKKDDTTAERIGDNSNIVIEYYIIVVYQPLTSPESIIQSSWVKNEESKKSLSNVILSEEGYTIADIVSNAKKRIDEIVSKVH
ncbi:hypothetical protein BDB01DRAFT_718169 [Pilobolus umbonatus]|nr:hypothetical protein BDB01DRAFT_718169 [Pilobolus umbonatus]